MSSAVYSTVLNCLTFVKTTTITYGQNLARSLKILPICNSSRFYKRQAIGSRHPNDPTCIGHKVSGNEIVFVFFSLAREMCSGGRIFRCLLLEENTGTGIYGRLPGILPVVRSMALG